MKKWVVASIIIILLFVSFTPTLYEWQSRTRIKPIRYFELVHNFPTDYNFYLSRIRQGKEGGPPAGGWLAVEKYTSEPHDASLLQVLYVLIGRVWDWSHGQTPYVWIAYHAMRVFFAGFLLLVIWKLVDWFFYARVIPGIKAAPIPGITRWKIITFLLAVTASTWPKFETVDGWPRLGGYMPWYSLMDAMQRITFLPHVLFGQALLVFILWVFMGGFIEKFKVVMKDDSRNWRSSNSGNHPDWIHPGNWVFLGVVGLIEGIVFPPGLMFLYVVLAVDVLLSRLKNLYGKIIFTIISIPSLVYYQILFQQYPWKRLVEFDVLHPTQFSYLEYFLAVGPVLPLGLLGVLYVFFRRSIPGMKVAPIPGIVRNQPFSLLVSWVLAWLGLMILFNFIPQQSPTRFTQMVPHVPLAILGVYFLLSLRDRSYGVAIPFGSRLLLRQLADRNDKLSVTIVSVIIVFFAFGSMASSFLWQKDFIDHKLRADYPAVPHGAEVMYPLKDIIDGLTWLQVYTPRPSVVLSGMTTGNYIPVYAGNTAYIGHANTVHLETKETAVALFYRNQSGFSWLKAQGIDYVFYGPEERELAGGVADLRQAYPQLTTVYDAGSVRIYKVP